MGIAFVHLFQLHGCEQRELQLGFAGFMYMILHLYIVSGSYT